MKNKIYPRPRDKQTVYLHDVITKPNIEVGDYTIYNDFVRDPRNFEKNNVLYHYPINGDKLKIGILFDCLRREIYVYERKSFDEVARKLYFSDFFRRMGA